MLSTETVWSRRAAPVGGEIDARTYNATIGAVLLYGLFANYIMVQRIPPEVVLGIPSIAFIIGYLGCIIAGTMIYQRSDNPAISFLGYNLLVLPLGLFLVRILPFHATGAVSQAALTTGLVTGIMMLLSTAYPRFFLGLDRMLFIAFIAVFLVELGMFLITRTNPRIFDVLMVGIFSGYIGYDWARAQALPKTLDNAVDAAAALYVDIVILFIRLLSLMSRR